MAISIWRCTLKRAASRLSLQRSLSLYNSSHGFCEEEIKRKLAQLKGGSVKLWKRDNGIAELCIHNPEKRNALTGAMAVELEERVCDLEKWQQGKGLIVYGAENTFCSGGDLKTEIAIANKQDGINVCMFMQNITARLQRLPLISVALVEGKAVGGGADLCVACDFRLMTEGSQIQFIHKHMGLVPVFGGATRLIQLIGSRHALKILSGAVRVHPELALNIGLADEVLSRGADGALEEAQKWISSYTKGPAEVTRAVKKAIVSGRERG
ncbi:ethylmalonyl-CoA decarboxylase-like isoform X1 [Hyperolius riggenbachi]|uniref:ethylmalonyl-CoA decarboxylase-like isoform X1 n=1 Tax=Hyperolius riggenbachi TaxID=752182 RepID=UPI0035A306D3